MVKLTINDVKAKKSYKKELESNPFLNKKIGDLVNGDEFGFKGYEFKISGGSDKQGFPMRQDIQGIGRKKVLAVSGIGIKKKEEGVRQRKTIHGNTIDENISQINLKVEKYGRDTIPKILGLEKEPEKLEGDLEKSLEGGSKDSLNDSNNEKEENKE